jgi:hypothetical protein
MKLTSLRPETVEMIAREMESIPDKYQVKFNSVHEGLAVLREEYVELENEIFFGEKKAKNHPYANDSTPLDYRIIWKEKIKREAVQVAAMAARIIQELT